MATFNPRSALDVVSKVLPALQDSTGHWTPFAAAAQLYDTVEIRTNATPPITINVRDLGGATGPNPIAQKLQPTITLTGPLGQKVLAPYGPASATLGTVVGIGGTFGVAAALGALGFILGRLSKRGVNDK